MNSLVLRTATRYLMPLLVLFSIFLLLRGHNEPGGGFIGGLLASAAFCLDALAYEVSAARRLLRVHPQVFIGSGLLLALGSGLGPLFVGQPFLTGTWLIFEAGEVGEIALGSTLFFDLGVDLVVIGVVLSAVFALLEEE